MKGEASKASKKQQREKRRSQSLVNEERFHALIEQSNDAIALLDVNGTILYASNSVKTVLGYTPQQFQAKAAGAYAHPNDVGEFSNKWADLLKKQGNQLTLEFRVKHKNGTWVWVEAHLTNHLNTPNIEAILGNFRNTSQRKRAEEQLKKSEEQLRFMAESMPQKIYTTDAEGSADYFNPQWEHYSGVPLEKLKGWGWRKLNHPGDREDTLSRWKYSIETGEVFSIEHRLRRHDKEYRWHITRARPMYDDEGKVTKWFGTSTDIHDSKLALKREHTLSVQAVSLTKEREQLIALNDSKDEFISLASHQLRTPATIVKQYLNLILDGYAGDLNPALYDMVASANTSNERQIEIVDDLLKVARLDAGKIKLAKQQTNMVPLIQDVVNQHLAILESRKQRVHLEVKQTGISASVDPSRMKMVLENLLDNASKYSMPRRTIHITVFHNDSAVVIAIRDHGVGIAKKDVPKLFHKFSRLDNPLSVSVGGTGLGLYWAKRIVDLHGGTIAVRASTRGSEFTVIIPD